MITGWEQFASDLTREFGPDFVRGFCESILDEEKARQELVYSSQQRIAAASATLDASWADGLGACHMRLDPTVYFYWTQRYGPGIWNDKSFVKALKRDNPSIVVKSRSRKTMIVRP
jgi:hypothetical protein